VHIKVLTVYIVVEDDKHNYNTLSVVTLYASISINQYFLRIGARGA
jgi:hypothetical protein